MVGASATRSFVIPVNSVIKLSIGSVGLTRVVKESTKEPFE